jgi:hypothetical protein
MEGACVEASGNIAAGNLNDTAAFKKKKLRGTDWLMCPRVFG